MSLQLNIAKLLLFEIDGYKSQSEEFRIKLVNYVAILLFFLELPYYFIFTKMGLHVASFWVIPAAISNLIVLWLNRQKHHALAGLSLIFFCSITLLYYACFLGKTAQAQLVYFALMPLGFIFFFDKRFLWILMGTGIPTLALIVLHITQFRLFQIQPIVTRYLELIAIYATLTTTLLMIMSLFFFYTLLTDAYRELKTANTILETQNTLLHTQQTLLKRRIAAIHDMAEQCSSLSEWQHMATMIFRYQLNLPPAKVWLPASPTDRDTSVSKVQIAALAEAPAYIPLEEPLARTILYHTQTLDWEAQGVSLILPLSAANNALIGLIGLTLPETLLEEDLDFVALVAKELQRNLQFIHATQTLKSLNIAEALKKSEKCLRERNITDRELEIIHLLINGASNATICATLLISESTTKTHLYNIFKKLSINSRFELLKWVNSQVIGDIV